jgi:P-type Ca2+ transporter type 2C
MVTIHDIRGAQPDDISPFDEVKEYHGCVVTMKGAPDLVLDLCNRYQDIDDVSRPLTDAMRMRILSANDTMTQDALRVLGVAYKDCEDMPDVGDVDALETDLIFVGPGWHDRSPATGSTARPRKSG